MFWYNIFYIKSLEEIQEDRDLYEYEKIHKILREKTIKDLIPNVYFIRHYPFMLIISPNKNLLPNHVV